MRRAYCRILILIAISLFATPLFTYRDVFRSVSGTVSTPSLSVQGEYYPSSNITDPSLIPGSFLNITVQGSNLPSINGGSDGGLQGFDITLTYNSSIIQPDLAGSNRPFCSDSDECLFANLTQSQFLTFANQTSLANGTLRLGMVAYNSASRVTGSGVLFKVGFLVVGRGITPIQVDSSKSILVGFAASCESSISSYTVQNMVLDNRQPWIITANPSSSTVSHGGSTQTTVTVTRVNSDGNVTLLIPAGNFQFLTYSFSARTGILDASQGIYSFTSTLTLSATTTAPNGTYTVQIVGHDTFSPGGFREYRLNYNVTVDPPVSSAIATHTVDLYRLVSIPTVTFVGKNVSSDPVLPLLANFTFAGSMTNQQNVIFASIVCGGTSPYSYSWNFGDGSTGSGAAPNHTYSGPGTFTVTLKVMDSNGGSFSSSQTVVVNSPSNSLIPVYLLVGSLVVLLLLAGFYLRRRRQH